MGKKEAMVGKNGFILIEVFLVALVGSLIGIWTYDAIKHVRCYYYGSKLDAPGWNGITSEMREYSQDQYTFSKKIRGSNELVMGVKNELIIKNR